ncbi:MAG: WXG100 family type VII secretion target [Oscillospiraceae bacterium]|jgi:WXG100 family type VII secretion target|nr:WXG100 family type VII secretion target [Oscillospiraceae bacterium]
MNYTDVDADRVLSVKAQIARDIDGAKNVYSVLKGQVIGALAPSWQGQAFDTFSQQFSAFLAAFDAFLKDCDTLNAELQKAGTNYNRADGDVRSLIAALPR